MKKIIVGAGLSGMVAAINLRQNGHDVEILEKAPGIGGVSLEFEENFKQRYVFGDMTPFDLEKLSKYINVDLKRRHIETDDNYFFKTLPHARFYSYGKKYDVNFPKKLQIKLIERGPRKSSLDYFIYLTALEHGVKFHFGASIQNKKDFKQLPEGTILSTGMFIGTYKMLDIPYTPIYGYFANRKIEDYAGPQLIAHFDRFMKDFCLFTFINGIGGATLFQKNIRLTEKSKEWYLGDLKNKEGISFPNWHLSEAMMAAPTGSIRNPRLFHDKFILSGTLAGMQDPFGAFGVHGALISGKIAAMAVENRKKAMIEFKRMNKWWRLCYSIKKIMDIGHPHVPRYLLKLILGLSNYYDLSHLFRFITAVPGFMELENNK